jgi:hypothetical protein
MASKDSWGEGRLSGTPQAASSQLPLLPLLSLLLPSPLCYSSAHFTNDKGQKQARGNHLREAVIGPKVATLGTTTG